MLLSWETLQRESSSILFQGLKTLINSSIRYELKELTCNAGDYHFRK